MTTYRALINDGKLGQLIIRSGDEEAAMERAVQWAKTKVKTNDPIMIEVRPTGRKLGRIKMMRKDESGNLINV